MIFLKLELHIRAAVNSNRDKGETHIKVSFSKKALSIKTNEAIGSSCMA
jgi:hypothetical protein